MKVEGYEVIKKLFSNEHGLAVYEVRQKRDHQPFLLRLADYSNNQHGYTQDQWYELYEKYQLTITNYKNLPHVSTISMLNESQVYSLVDYEEGKLLKNTEKLRKDEVSQLISAVRHLHSKKFVHGAILLENIWLTSKGKVILYGAGELRALGIGRDHRYSSDIQQLIAIIKDFSLLSEEDLERLEIERPTTIDELDSIITDAKQIDQKEKEKEKEKGGLVEKEEKREPEKVVAAPTSVKEEKLSEKKINPTVEDKKQKEHREEQQVEEKSKKVLPWIKKISIGIVSVLALLFVIGLFTEPEPKEVVVPVEQAVSMDAGVEEQEETNDVNTTEIMTQTDVSEELNKPVEKSQKSLPTQEYLTTSITDQDIRDFMDEFSILNVQAINRGDFSIVKHLYDPNGVAHNSQRNYIQYLVKKGITEQLIAFEVKAISPIDDNQFNVKTYEEYEIDYNGESKKFKSFNGTYILTIHPDYSLSVNELIDSKQLESYEIKTEEYVTNDGLDTTDDTGAIESAVRLHYGSISNDDFTTAYKQFSSSRKKKETQEGWEKGLQENLYDELTSIDVEQVDSNRGRVYIEMTSYDDNRDGTILVQNWAGYWNLVKESNRWTLDDSELQKVGSRVEVQ